MKKILVKARRGKPKRLRILRKARYIRRWLLNNPWIRPMSIFNLAAIMIQKVFRGHRVRRGKMIRSKKNPKVSNGRKSKKQLDKYLSSLDQYNHRVKPLWLEGGYSSWCAARIQSWWRMIPIRRRFFLTKRFVCQIAAVIIQNTWRAHFEILNNSRTIVVSEVDIKNNAAYKIQLCWRSFCNKRVYRYLKELVLFKLKGAPADLLRTIIPTESDFLDRASGIHVRFRLGGSIFPPKVYFKIFTHRPLCDVNAFAPRNYALERTEDENVPLATAAKFCSKKHPPNFIRVGTSYFGTKVKTSIDLDKWYRRDENNPWRPIASQAMDDILTPPWLRSTNIAKKVEPFHFSRLKRKEDLLIKKKKKKLDWWRKAYLLAAAESDTPVDSQVDNKALDRINHLLEQEESHPTHAKFHIQASIALPLETSSTLPSHPRPILEKIVRNVDHIGTESMNMTSIYSHSTVYEDKSIDSQSQKTHFLVPFQKKTIPSIEEDGNVNPDELLKWRLDIHYIMNFVHFW